MMSFFRQSLLLAAKDMKIFFNDRGALLFALLFPFVFIILFSLVMGDQLGGEERALTVYAATAEAEENSLSRLIIAAMAAEESGLDVQETDPGKARTALEEGKIDGYIFFPANFSQKVYARAETGLTVFYDPEATSTRAALASIARAIAADIVSYRITYHAFSNLAADHGYPADGHLPPGGLDTPVSGRYGGRRSRAGTSITRITRYPRFRQRKRRTAGGKSCL